MYRPDGLASGIDLLWSVGTSDQVWEMLRASHAGDLDVVRKLVDEVPELVRCHYAYRTPLYFAVRENQIEIAQHLLQHLADPLVFTLNESLVQMSAMRGNSQMESLLRDFCLRLNASPRGNEMARLIRDRRVDEVTSRLEQEPSLLNVGDETSNQPIHWAVMTRQLHLVDRLLKFGADINARRADGATPIQLANGDYHFRGWRDVSDDVQTTPAEVRNHLIKQGAVVDAATCAYLGDLEGLKAIVLEDPASVNRCVDYVTYYDCSGSPLRNAASGGHFEIVRWLVERGADPNLCEEGFAPNGYALYQAISRGHDEIARYLLDQGANPNAQIESSGDCISAADSRHDREMANLLASYGGVQGVDIMAYYGDVRSAAALFEGNSNLAFNVDALSNAAGEGNELFVRLMLRHQPELAKQCAFGSKTPAITEILFSHDMDPNHADWLGVTPMHRFAQAGDLEQAGIFLARGARLDTCDEELCTTPLGWAARFGKLRMVEFLVEHGAELLPANVPSWATPVAWAIRNEHHEIAERLKAG